MAEENAALALQTHLLPGPAGARSSSRTSAGSSGPPGPPHRIEGFDISNIQGQEAVGSMVVWEAGGMKKDDYKRFKIRTVPGADDFAMMAEVLRRRYGKALEDGETLLRPRPARRRPRPAERGLPRPGGARASTTSPSSPWRSGGGGLPPGSLHPLVLDLASPALQTLQRSGTRRTASRSPTTRSSVEARPSVSVARPDPGRRVRLDPDEPPEVARLRAPRAPNRLPRLAELAVGAEGRSPKLAQRIHDFLPTGES